MVFMNFINHICPRQRRTSIFFISTPPWYQYYIKVMTYVFVKLNHGFSISPRVFHRTISFSNTPVRSKNDSKLKLSSNIRSSIKTPSSTLYIFIPNDATSLSQGFETFWTQKRHRWWVIGIHYHNPSFCSGLRFYCQD